MADKRIAGTDWRPDQLTRLPPLVQAVLWRRSFRAYAPDPVGSEVLAELDTIAASLPSLDGRRSGWVETVSDPTRRDRVMRALTSGLVGKANTWLRRAQPSAVLLVHGDEDKSLHADNRWYYNVDAALAGEAVVLAAAAHRMGSCWMAAIDEKRTRRELALPAHRRIVAAIPVGRPRTRRTLDYAGVWDRMARRLVSSRRKPAAAMHFLESFGTAEKLPAVRLDAWPGAISGVSVRDRLVDLRPWAEVGGEAPSEEQLAWLVELCRQAPTADNAQTWRLILARDPGRISRLLHAATKGQADLADMTLQKPGCAILAAGSPFFVRHRTAEQPFFLIDVPIGLLHLLLGAEEMGLCWNVLFLFDHKAAGRVVDLPGDHKVVALLLLGTEGERHENPRPWVQLRRSPPR